MRRAHRTHLVINMQVLEETLLCGGLELNQVPSHERHALQRQEQKQ